MIDVHTHLDMKYIDGNVLDNSDEEVKEIVDRAIKNGIQKMITISNDMKSCYRALEFTELFDIVYCTVGIHPHEIESFDYNELENILKANNKKIVAIGECGLEDCDVDLVSQEKVFRDQIELSIKYDLPLMIHSRGKEKECLKIIKEYNIKKAVFHCYTGSVEVLDDIVKNNYYISVGGISTFKNGKNVHEIVREIPLENLLLETDAPFLTPHPHRGKSNESSYLSYIVDAISELKSISKQELINITTSNAETLFARRFL